MKTGRERNGYILLESVVAMAVLAVGLFAVHGAMRQTLATRGQARDYTQARFLLEHLVAEAEFQPQLVEGTQSGRFDDDLARFSWTRTVSRVPISLPPVLSERLEPAADRPAASSVLPPDAIPVQYLGKVAVTVAWTRGGLDFERTVETLVPAAKVYVPKDERAATSPQ